MVWARFELVGVAKEVRDKRTHGCGKLETNLQKKMKPLLLKGDFKTFKLIISIRTGLRSLTLSTVKKKKRVSQVADFYFYN